MRPVTIAAMAVIIVIQLVTIYFQSGTIDMLRDEANDYKKAISAYQQTVNIYRGALNLPPEVFK